MEEKARESLPQEQEKGAAAAPPQPVSDWEQEEDDRDLEEFRGYMQGARHGVTLASLLLFLLLLAFAAGLLFFWEDFRLLLLGFFGAA